MKNPFRSQSCCSIPLKLLTKVIENSTAKVGTPSGHSRGTANAKACEDKEEARSGSDPPPGSLFLIAENPNVHVGFEWFSSNV